MANGLHASGRLSAEDMAWWRRSNDRANAAYVDPSAISSDCYDDPRARSWFKVTAIDLLALTGEYVALLNRYGLPWVELRTNMPGQVTYEDDVQVVAVPWQYPDDWPL
jgi:hypothetical protein